MYEAESEKICDFDLNWNMTEIALWMMKIRNDIEDNEEDDEQADSIYLRVAKISSQNINLKSIARLVCLKSFNDIYLKENLPKCLQNYLGLK